MKKQKQTAVVMTKVRCRQNVHISKQYSNLWKRLYYCNKINTPPVNWLDILREYLPCEIYEKTQNNTKKQFNLKYMKKLFILPLAISSLAFANKYTLSFTGSTLTNKPFGIEKLTNNQKTTHQGSMFEVSLAEDKGQKFFGIKSRNAIHIGNLTGQWCVGNHCYNKVNALALGVDKQLYHNFGRVQVLGFFGLGYKFTGLTTQEKNYDYALPSQFYFRLGTELNYFLTKKVSVGLQYKHFSNGGLTTTNYGYDMFGMKINFVI